VPSVVLLGHEDWVRSLAFRAPSSQDDQLVLASGSQDATVRLWNIEPFVRRTPTSDGQKSVTSSDVLLDDFEALLGSVTDGGEDGKQISLKRYLLTVKNQDG
jgi:elongator complex protein 2